MNLKSDVGIVLIYLIPAKEGTLAVLIWPLDNLAFLREDAIIEKQSVWMMTKPRGWPLATTYSSSSLASPEIAAAATFIGFGVSCDSNVGSAR